MTRPASHHSQIPAQRCGSCFHGHIVEYKDDLLCFHGDAIKVTPSCLRDYWSDVLLNGEPVGIMDGDEYSAVWAGRQVDDTERCDEWRGR